MGFKEADFYRKLTNKKVHCNLCPHSCFIDNGETGRCIVRQNIDGKLKSMHYAKPHLMQYKNIEDHSIYHFIPESRCLSIGIIGDNLIDINENLLKKEEEINKIPKFGQEPNQFLEELKKTNTKIAAYGLYQLSDPIISYEYLKDIFEKSNKLKNVISTKGFISDEPAQELSKKINAISVEIISVNPEIYKKKYCANLENIFKTIKIMKENNVWVEICVQIISGLNDNLYELRRIISWVLNNLGSDTPIHFKYNLQDEKLNELIQNIRRTAMNIGLNYVYIDNGKINEMTTFCPDCKRSLIIRNDKKIENKLINGKCICGKKINGVWE
ncbi:MAG TPA: hypothetical protein P5277_02725 [Candidatus Paceibacterota bacterium]|nr:hypothetical protein [Candidatus Paceibacterota bacterium]